MDWKFRYNEYEIGFLLYLAKTKKKKLRKENGN